MVGNRYIVPIVEGRIQSSRKGNCGRIVNVERWWNPQDSRFGVRDGRQDYPMKGNKEPKTLKPNSRL